MGKIGDLFVRLGLKKDDYSKGLKEAKTEAEGFGSKLGTIAKGVAAGFGVVAVGVGVAVKAMKDLSRQNQTLSDSWGKTVASMKAAWDSFRTDVVNMTSPVWWRGLGMQLRPLPSTTTQRIGISRSSRRIGSSRQGWLPRLRPCRR